MALGTPSGSALSAAPTPRAAPKPPPTPTPTTTPTPAPPTTDYPGQIPFTSGAPGVDIPMPPHTTPTPAGWGYLGSQNDRLPNVLPSSPASPIYTSGTRPAPTWALQYANSQIQQSQANAQLQAANLWDQYRAQIAGINASGGGSRGPAPDWALMAEKLRSALASANAAYKSQGTALNDRQKLVLAQFTKSNQDATSDATARGAITSRGYGNALTAILANRRGDEAAIAKARSDNNLGWWDANQSYKFGLRDIENSKRAWAAGGGGPSAASLQAARDMALAQVQGQILALNQGSVDQAQSTIAGLIQTGVISPEEGGKMMYNLMPTLSVHKPRKVI